MEIHWVFRVHLGLGWGSQEGYRSENSDCTEAPNRTGLRLKMAWLSPRGLDVNIPNMKPPNCAHLIFLENFKSIPHLSSPRKGQTFPNPHGAKDRSCGMHHGQRRKTWFRLKNWLWGPFPGSLSEARGSMNVWCCPVWGPSQNKTAMGTLRSTHHDFIWEGRF